MITLEQLNTPARPEILGEWEHATPYLKAYTNVVAFADFVDRRGRVALTRDGTFLLGNLSAMLIVEDIQDIGHYGARIEKLWKSQQNG